MYMYSLLPISPLHTKHYGIQVKGLDINHNARVIMITQYPTAGLIITKEQPYVLLLGPLLTNSVCQQQLTSVVLMQDIFLIAQNYGDHQLQQYVAWTISFFRSISFMFGHEDELKLSGVNLKLK
ncbi:hypothetical protein ACFE04_009830 [Oxalis oulophora]